MAEIKADENLKRIPVVVLTASEAEQDITRAYDLRADCYITKSFDLDQFVMVVKSIENFWVTISSTMLDSDRHCEGRSDEAISTVACN